MTTKIQIPDWQKMFIFREIAFFCEADEQVSYRKDYKRGKYFNKSQNFIPP